MLSSRKQTTRYKSKIIKELEALPDTNYHNWTESEAELLKKYYPTKDSRGLARVLKKSIHAVYSKAKSLGLIKE